MSWSAISTDDVLRGFTPAESAMLGGIAGAASGLDDRLGKTVREWKGTIRARGTVNSDDGTVPDQCIPHIIAMARWRWLGDFPGLKAYKSDDRKVAAEKAEEYLLKIGSGAVLVEPPDGDSSGLPSPAVCRPRRDFSKCDQEGV